MTLFAPTYLKDLIPYLTNPSAWNYGMWNAKDPAIWPDGSVHPGEGGVDLTSMTGTPILAMATGPVLQAGYWNDQQHGVVTQRVSVPGYGLQDLYYQHIYIDPSIKPGMIVQKGQKIGTTGGFGEVELGFNAAWGWPWGGFAKDHPGPWPKDPRPMLKALMTGDAPAVGLTSQTGSGGGSSSGGSDIMSGILSGLGLPTATDVQSFVQRFTLVFFGGLFVLIGILIVFFSSDAGKKVTKAGVEAAAA